MVKSNRFKLKIRLLLGSIPFLVLFLLWIGVAGLGLVKEIFLPPISAVWDSLVVLFSRGNYIADVWISIYRVMVAFAVSAVLAIPLGLFAGRYPRMAQVFEPFVGFIRYLPVPAFVPLCILWFGLGDAAKIIVIFLGTFFQLILMASDVARNVPREYFEAALTLGASERDLFLKILWRASQPGLLNASRIAVGWAWTYLVVAEIAGATQGIGFRILQAQRFINTPEVFAGIVVIGTLGMTTDLLLQAYYRMRFKWA